MINKIKQKVEGYDPKIFGKQEKSAVLLPLIKVQDEWHILYEVRSKVVSQAGDSSFPGGRVEDNETYEEAAIRETMEELNIKRENIVIYGEIDYIVSERMIIHCFVGKLVNLKIEAIQPNVEVEEVYTVPLNFLLRNKPKYFAVNFNPTLEEDFVKNQADNSSEYRFENNRQRIPYYEISTHSLWGFTANLTERFIEIITEDIE